MSAVSSDRSSSARSGAGRLGIVFVVIGSLVLVVMALSDRPVRPFDLDSSAPDGYRALRLVLEDNGIDVRSVAVGDDPADGVGTGTVVYVPRPTSMTSHQLSGLTAAAGRGATVVYGSVPPSDRDLERHGNERSPEDSGRYDSQDVDPRSLIDLPAELIDGGVCSIAELADLGTIGFVLDWVHVPVENGPGLPDEPEVVGTCYGSEDAAQFAEIDGGAGRVFVLASPYLWTNAMLKSSVDAEADSSERVHNDMTAWRIISGGGDGARNVELVVVDTSSAAPVPNEDGRDLIELLPVPFKALSAVLALATVVFVWGRARRLGGPVEEQPPVVVESSELTAATGRLLLDDPTFVAHGADLLRRRARDELATEVGVHRNADPVEMCAAVGSRAARDPAEVAALLYGDDPVETIGAAMDLETGIERLRMEVGDGRSL